jgi:hypothetical protein
MVRTQIQLREDQYRTLKELAVAKHTSMAKLIRQSVDQWLRSLNEPDLDEKDLDEKRRRAMSIVGKFRSGKTDISTEHDKYLEEIYAS